MSNDTKPATISQALRQRKAKKSPRWRRIIRWLRFGLGACLVVLLVYVVVSYRIYTLGGEYRSNTTKIQSPFNDVMPGDMLLLQSMNLWREPKVGDLVIYSNPEPTEDSPSDIMGRVVGLPGETIKRTGPTMTVADRDPLNIGFEIGSGLIKSGDTVPEGKVLIVTDNDAVAYPDSRVYGYVPIESIRRRVVMNLTILMGRDQGNTATPD